ncbi:MAG: SRPBCC domain-containing protein [Gemmataceae bacterium]|nr:SRPBCC domain-containing protein [Gemmataceae bacterium]MCI0738277.1 SRPBCC domain-containing protein [Gemmataceae bacterium]
MKHEFEYPTRSHTLSMTLPAVPEKVFALLITPSAIRGWWSAARAIVQPQTGGLWAAAWGEREDDPDYVCVATIRDFDPPHRLVLDDYRYFAKSGPLPFDADFTTEFRVEPAGTGAILTVNQEGFPTDAAADEFYRACEKGWHDTFAAIRRFLDLPSE